MPRARRTTTALAAGVAALMVLTGCANPIEKAVEGLAGRGVEKLVEQATGVEVDGITGSAEVPADFPSEIPLPSGKPVHALRIATDEGITWSMSYQLGSAAEFDALIDDARARGLSEESAVDFGEQMRTVQLRRDDLVITLTIISDDDEHMLQMMVLRSED